MKIISKRHADYDGLTPEEAVSEYLRIVQQCPMYGASFFLAKYVGFWSFPQLVEIMVEETGVVFVHRSTKEILKTISWGRLEELSVETKEDLALAAGCLGQESQFVERITFTLVKDPMKQALGEDEHEVHIPEQHIYSFETDRARELASLISSYSPHKKHQKWAVGSYLFLPRVL